MIMKRYTLSEIDLYIRNKNKKSYFLLNIIYIYKHILKISYK